LITEIALLNIRKGSSEQFENTFATAQNIIASMKGYVSHQLQKCLEDDHKYLLVVEWETAEDHEIGFRKSEAYKEWKKLLHHFYDPFPIVEHYKKIY
jgi:heme-degrading monooxygenase HmoA